MKDTIQIDFLKSSATVNGQPMDITEYIKREDVGQYKVDLPRLQKDILRKGSLREYLLYLGWADITERNDYVFFPTFTFHTKTYGALFVIKNDLQYGGEGQWLTVTRTDKDEMESRVCFNGVITSNEDVDFLIKAFQINDL